MTNTAVEPSTPPRRTSWFHRNQSDQKRNVSSSSVSPIKETSPTTTSSSSNSSNEGTISKFMNFVRSPPKTKSKKTTMQREWSKRNQMNLSMGVSTPHLDRR
eukprot:scaffold12553_cov76-Cylindrotheca_fusiformis.AAC.1